MKDTAGKWPHADPLATLYITHVTIITVGFLTGLLAAYLFTFIPFDFSSEIRKAKELGIVSISIMKGHPMSRDLVVYLSLLFFPFFFSVVPWYLWARKRMDMLNNTFTPSNSPSGERKRACLYACLSIIMGVLLTFDMTLFFMPNYGPTVGAWPFLGEEGETLAWVQSILSGGTYGKDFFCLYGPLLVYPLAWAMKLFGQTVVVERVLKYCYDLFTFGFVVFFLLKTLRIRFLVIFMSFIYLLFFPPTSPLSINFTTLRFVLGIVPFLLLQRVTPWHILLRRQPREWSLFLSSKGTSPDLSYTASERGASTVSRKRFRYRKWSPTYDKSTLNYIISVIYLSFRESRIDRCEGGKG